MRTGLWCCRSPRCKDTSSSLVDVSQCGAEMNVSDLEHWGFVIFGYKLPFLPRGKVML